MTITYTSNDPKGWNGDPSLGAAMGRPMIMDVPRRRPSPTRGSHD